MESSTLAVPQPPSEAGSVTPSVSGLAPVSGRGRRGSATNRAVAAVQDAFPLPVSPSPLIRVRSPNRNSVPVVKRIPHGAAIHKADDARLLALRRELQEAQPKPVHRDLTKQLLPDVLRTIFSFVGSTLSSLHTVSHTCRAWNCATFPMVSAITLYPQEASIAALNRTGSLASLARALQVATRGQHVERLTIMDSRSVYALDAAVEGPVVSAQALSSLVLNLPHLTYLDIRGIRVRDFTPWSDHFLADIAQSCPRLQTLRVGAQFLRNWSPQWWAPLTSLRELVVGSRREDCDWHDPSPLTLPDDFFAMLRSPNHDWAVVKIWPRLAAASFAQLLMASQPFPQLRHLTLNCAGNTAAKPLEDAAKDDAAAQPEKKKPDPKAAKKGQDENNAAGKCPFPQLRALVVADVTERPELASEILARCATAAPLLKFFTVTNTHRNAPGHVAAAPAKPVRAKPAAVAAAAAAA